MFLCCWRICLVCLALELVGPCVVLGFSVGMEAFDELLSFNVPWSQELPGVRVWTSILLQNVSTLRARTFSCSSTYSHCLPSFIQSTWITGTCSQLLSNSGQLGQVETTGPKTEPMRTSYPSPGDIRGLENSILPFCIIDIYNYYV